MTGSYAYYKQGPSSVNTRVVHGGSHLDYNFGPQHTSSDLYQQYLRPNHQVQQFLFQKQPTQNDVYYAFQAQNDEYTRNLVPPPPYTKYEEKEKVKVKEFYKSKDNNNNANTAEKEIIPNNQQFGSKPVKEPSIVQESVVVALNPPPLHQQKQQQNYYNVDSNFPAPSKEQAVDVQVTKEKLNHFPSKASLNYNPQIINLDEFFTVPKATNVELNLPTYDVTETKYDPQPPVYQVYSTHMPSYKQQESNKHQSEVDFIKPFLPTPIIPGNAPPSPTQSAVSELYAYMKNKQEDLFSIKEVSTHYPIIGTPSYHEYETSTTTPKTAFEEETTLATTEKQYNYQRRPSQRRRRPTNKQRYSTTQEPLTSTEEFEDVQKAQLQEQVAEIVKERPQRRKPIRYRTTETPSMESEEYKPVRTRQRVKSRPTDPPEVPSNHKLFEEELPYNVHRRRPLKPEEPKEPYAIEEQNNPFESTEEIKPSRKRGRPSTYQQQEVEEEEEKPTENQQIAYDTFQHSTEKVSSTFFQNPENEVDFSTFKSVNPVTIQEEPTENNDDITLPTTIPTTTAVTTTTTTTTTTEAPTTTTTRTTRRRPINYNVSRPRFSVKDYRQRLNQYSSTSTSTTETPHTQRTRLPSRIRKPTRTTAAPEEHDEDTTEVPRQRFKPKDPRFRAQYSANNNADDSVTDKRINRINTRLRPFNKQRSTTEPTTTTMKVSIKPNLFSNRRRPTPVSLKSKIANKYQKDTSSEEETTQYEEAVELKKVETTSLENNIDRMDATSTPAPPPEALELSSTQRYDDDSTDKNESIIYSQRVSDLTSSAQKEYETPGLFKNVSPTSRRVPNYFTIATDDPILPIEAFFPNLKDKEKET